MYHFAFVFVFAVEVISVSLVVFAFGIKMLLGRVLHIWIGLWHIVFVDVFAGTFPSMFPVV